MSSRSSTPARSTPGGPRELDASMQFDQYSGFGDDDQPLLMNASSAFAASSRKEKSQPQVTYERVATAADAKINAPFAIQIVQGVLAGATLSLGAMNANLVEAAVKNTTAIPALSNLLGGAVFPVGLIAIFLTGANLFTGNCMYFVPSFINGSVPRCRALLFLLVR